MNMTIANSDQKNAFSVDDSSLSLASHLALIQQLLNQPPELVLLTSDEAATFLRCSRKTLEDKRVLGQPPRFRKYGSRVRYTLRDLMDCLEVRTNTCR